jgi:hypothetical protein
MQLASHVGIKAIGVFLFFGAAMAAFAATLLIHPGTVLDHAWSLNPEAHRELGRFGKPVGLVFLLLGLILGTTAVGWLRRKYWAWLLTTTVFVIQAVGDAINLLRGDYVRAGLGLIIVGALLFYVTRSRVRAVFSTDNASSIR